jgi:Tfp pilus assembly protein PilX
MITRVRMRGSDGGASLIIVLIVVTVISAVMGVILSQVDTSVRTTMVLDDQASDSYAADAAGQAVIKQLQNGNFACTSTATANPTTLGSAGSPFYVPVSTQDGSLNAYADCTPDTSDGTSTTTTTSGSGVGISNNNLPSYALLALEPNTTAEGLTFPLSNKTICIENGNVAANGAVNATNNVLGVRWTGTGTLTDCGTGSSTSTNGTLTIQAHGTTGSNGCLPNATSDYHPTNCSNLPTLITTPTAPAPPSATGATLDPTPVCKKQSTTTYAAFVPGKYTIVSSATRSSLNTPCKSGSSWVAADYEWFSPGTYYFDFGSTPWTWPTTLVGGTPTSGPSVNNADGSITTPAIAGLDPTNANTLASLAGIATWPTSSSQKPNACADPTAQKQYPGVEFVFGGTSSFTPNPGGNAELCGTYSSTAPPIAIYGTSSGSDVPGVTAQTLCVNGVTPVTCSASFPNSNGNTLINTTSNGQAQFYIKGFLYAPTAPVNMNVKNSNGQIFDWGVVVWNFSLNINGVSPTAAFIQLPSSNQGFQQQTQTTYTIRYLNVWTCLASASPCAHTGTPDLRVKVKIDPLTNQATILSWSHRN